MDEKTETEKRQVRAFCQALGDSLARECEALADIAATCVPSPGCAEIEEELRAEARWHRLRNGRVTGIVASPSPMSEPGFGITRSEWMDMLGQRWRIVGVAVA